jgi:hypothetical protein
VDWPGFCLFELPFADLREDGAEVLVLDDDGLRNLSQLVEGVVGQVEPTTADRQPVIGMIDNRHALAAEPACDRVGLEQKHDFIVLQGQAVGDRPLFAPGHVDQIVAGRP